MNDIAILDICWGLSSSVPPALYSRGVGGNSTHISAPGLWLILQSSRVVKPNGKSITNNS